MITEGFQTLTKLLWGTGVGKIPGAYTLHRLLYERLREDTIKVQGSKMCVSMDNLPHSYAKTFQAYAFDTWEPLTTKLFKEVIRKDDVVLDLGANIGYYTLLASRLVGEEGRVIAFEPEPTNFEILTRNILLNDSRNVLTIQKAVTDKKGKTNLYVDSKDTGAHTLCNDNRLHKHIEVDTVSLDEFLPSSVKVDVIKMDIEGSEMKALAGMSNVIERSNNLKMFMEYHSPMSMYTPSDIFHTLHNGYHFNIRVIEDYRKKRGCTNVGNPEELDALCKRNTTVNLFLYR